MWWAHTKKGKHISNKQQILAYMAEIANPYQKNVRLNEHISKQLSNDQEVFSVRPLPVNSVFYKIAYTFISNFD